MGVHVPVMLMEAVDALAVRPGGVYIDGTLGRGGHSAEILRRAGKATLLGIDRDDEAIAESRANLAGFSGAEVRLVRGRHGDMGARARAEGSGEGDGVLLGRGVASPQLDDAARGFCFREDGPLDMRMDRSRGETGAGSVATRGGDERAGLFRALGEEPNARRIAKAVVRERARGRIATTRQLADIVEGAVGRRGAHHPATRVFQALRMEVNDELGELARALDGGLSLLREGGRFVVITFESLTDRTVKRFFAAHAGREESLQGGGSRWVGASPRVRLVARRAARASAAEVAENTRARSAKMRVAERMGR